MRQDWVLESRARVEKRIHESIMACVQVAASRISGWRSAAALALTLAA
jgi:hypothetical protein